MPSKRKPGLFLLVVVGALTLFALRFRFDADNPELSLPPDPSQPSEAQGPRRADAPSEAAHPKETPTDSAPDAPQDAAIPVLEGRAVGPDEAPLAGVRVLAVRSDSVAIPDLESPPSEDDSAAVTDDAGRFRLEVPEESAAYAVYGAKAGYIAAWVGNVRPENGPVLLRLDRGKVFEGRVLDLDGKPIAGARVVYQAFLAGSRSHIEVISDAQGRYRLDGVPFESPRRMGWLQDPAFFVSARGFAPRRISAWLLGVEEAAADAVIHQDFVLSRGGALQVTVVDGVTGQPLEGARVTLHPNGVDGPAMTSLDVREPRDVIPAPPVTTVTTDARGRVDLPHLPASYGGLLTLPVPVPHPRWGYLRASLAGHAPTGAPVTAVAREGDRKVVTLTLYPAASLEGRVLTPDGRPQPGALVTAELEGWLVYHVARFAPPDRPPPAEMIYFVRQEGQKGQVRVLTDDAGRFRFEALPVEATRPTQVRIGAATDNMATGYGWAALQAGRRVSTEDLTLAPSRDLLLIQGRVVTEDDEPVPGARIALEWGRPVWSDGRGRFQFYTEGFDRRLSRSPILTVTAPGFARWRAALPKTLPADGLPIVLSRPRRVAGRVLDAEGQPVEGATVRASPSREEARWNRHATLTDAQGRFLFDELPEGRLDVSARHPFLDLGRIEEKGVLPEGEELVLRFTQVVPRLGTVAVHLSDARTGGPVLAAVEILVRQGSVRRAAVRRSLDAAMATSVPEGACTLTVKAPGYVERTLPITVTADATTSVDVRLEPAIRVELSLEVEAPEDVGRGTFFVRVAGEGGAPFTRPISGPSGTLTLDTLGPGRWTITASNRAEGRRARVTARPLDLKLEPGDEPVRATLKLVTAGVVVIPLDVLGNGEVHIPPPPGSGGEAPTPESLKTYFDTRREILKRAQALTVTVRRGGSVIQTVRPSNDVELDAEHQQVRLRLPLPTGPCRIQVRRGDAWLLDRDVEVKREGATHL